MTKEALHISQCDRMQQSSWTLSVVKETFKALFCYFVSWMFFWNESRVLFWSENVTFLWFDFNLVRLCWFLCVFTRDAAILFFILWQNWHHLLFLGCQVCLLSAVSLARLWLLSLNFVNFLVFFFFFHSHLPSDTVQEISSLEANSLYKKSSVMFSFWLHCLFDCRAVKRQRSKFLLSVYVIYWSFLHHSWNQFNRMSLLTVRFSVFLWVWMMSLRYCGCFMRRCLHFITKQLFNDYFSLLLSLHLTLLSCGITSCVKGQRLLRDEDCWELFILLT